MTILGISAFAFLQVQGPTSDSQPASFEVFVVHLENHGIHLKELRAPLYMYLSADPTMTLEDCTALPFFPERLNAWHGVVVISQRHLKNITVVFDVGSRKREQPYAFSIGSFDVFGDPVLVSKIMATFKERSR
jgi:hypothetical protein